MNYVDNPFINPTTISVCTGLRRLEEGVERAIGPVRAAAYVEVDTFIVENLLAAMEAGMVAPAPIWLNLKTFDPRPFRGIVDAVIGGYPCQGESIIGKRKLWDDPRFLYPHIERIIDTIGPSWGLFENVAGHLSGSFPYVLDSLQSMGYAVEAGIFTAQEVGAPHLRERLFILAIKKELVYAYGKHGQGKQSCNSYPEERQRPAIGQARSSDTIDLWPARPGQRQYDWEEPHTIKPGVDFTINGYDFTKDLLRASGNGVVEQTAELAFRTLLKKHGL